MSLLHVLSDEDRSLSNTVSSSNQSVRVCVCVCMWTHNEPGLIISQEDIACFVSPFLLMQNASYIMQHAHKCARLLTQKNKKYPHVKSYSNLNQPTSVPTVRQSCMWTHTHRHKHTCDQQYISSERVCDASDSVLCFIVFGDSALCFVVG